MYKVILYYNFKSIEDPNSFCMKHKKKCQMLNLMGRVYISSEGINGTLAGSEKSIASYKEYLHSLNGFSDTEFKDDVAKYIPFKKLIVKLRPEIVALRTDEELDVEGEPLPHLSPEQWKKELESSEEYQLIDVRNNYESDVGHFQGAIRPDVENFFDFPQWLDKAGLDSEKKVLMYCTGGIRCEKFSILMKKKGFKNIAQLQGGILNYAKHEGDAHYKGKCFVFDDRLTVPIEKDQKEPLTKCEITGEPCDTYVNCANCDCNRLFICTEEGAVQMEGCCSEECKNAPRRRPFNKENVFAPSEKWYNYFESKTKDGFGKLKHEYERT